MCHDRERLISYVYDECEVGERQVIDDHLAECSDCRQEVAGLRAVRQDLLAWDVPSHASIWRPVAPARTSWREVPAWAFAAAASLMLMSGVAGGVVAQALARPGSGVLQQTAAVEPARIATPPGMATTAVEIADLERRLAAVRAELRQEMRAEMDDRVRRISIERARPAVSDDVRYTLTALYNDMLQIRNRQLGIEDQFEGLVLTSQAQATPVSLQGR
jgi:hypothetical protein